MDLETDSGMDLAVVVLHLVTEQAMLIVRRRGMEVVPLSMAIIIVIPMLEEIILEVTVETTEM